MKTVPASLDAFIIPDSARAPGLGMLDPISVMIHDERPGAGSLTVTCYGQAWTCRWNATGTNTVREFVRDVTDPDYVARCLIRGASGHMKRASEKRQIAYITDIC